MKCPKCGSEIKDGHLYCDVCGEEIRIVPDFDAALDANLQVNLSDVLDDISISNVEGSITKEIGITKDIANTEELIDNKPIEYSKAISVRVIVAIAAICIVLIAVISGIFYSINKYYSYDSQYEKAFEQFDNGEYEESIKTLKRVISMDDTQDKPKLLLCDNYYELGKYDEALTVLEGLMEVYPGDMNIYERLVKNYEAKGDNKSISELVKETQDESVKYMYGDYLKPTLTISPEAGTYTENQYVILGSDIDGTIYYTLDESEPDEKSLKYTEPIEIEPGEVTIKAVCISDKGIASDMVQAVYVVDFAKPDAPQIMTKTGQFTTPTLIMVDVPEGETCYYTIDNSEPTVESNVYEGPIAMYIGKHNFKFACIDEKGISSDVVSAEYSLDIVNLVDMGMAHNNLILLLDSIGGGTKDKAYKVEQAYVFNGSTYYLINEYVNQMVVSADTDDETEEVEKKTGVTYAVDVLTGLTFRTNHNIKDGTYTLSPF